MKCLTMLSLLSFLSGPIGYSDESDAWLTSRATPSCVFSKGIRVSFQANELRLSSQSKLFQGNHCLRGGENEGNEIGDELLKKLQSLTLSSNSGLKNAREDINRVMEMTQDLKDTLKSVNDNLDEEESSRDELSEHDSSSNFTITEQVQALLNPEGEYDDIFDEEGSEMHRDKIHEVMRQFDLNLTLELKDDSELQKLRDIMRLFDETKKNAESQRRQVDFLRIMLEGKQHDNGYGEKEINLFVGGSPSQAVDKGQIFPTVSQACNQSRPGQTIRVLAGQHNVGNCMCRFGVREDGTPIEWANVMHVPRNWSFCLIGDQSSVVDGRIVTMDGSNIRLQHIEMISRLSRNDSPIWGKNPFSGSEEKQISGISLFEILGTVEIRLCNMSINGGTCLVSFGDALVDLKSCWLGGFGAEEKREQVDDDINDGVIMRRFTELMSDSQPQASQGVAAFNNSKIYMRSCQIQHVWNGGVSLYQDTQALLDDCQVRGVGFAVGIDDASSAAVTNCYINVESDPLLQTGAFYAMSNSAAASLRSEGNEIVGNTWVGQLRPGTIEPESLNAGSGTEISVDQIRGTSGTRRRGKARQADLAANENDRFKDEWSQVELNSMLAELESLKDQITDGIPSLAQLDRNHTSDLHEVA